MSAIVKTSSKKDLAAIATEIKETADLYGITGTEIVHLKRAYFFGNISNGLVPDIYKGDVASLFVMSQLADEMQCPLIEVLKGGYMVNGRHGWYTEFKIKRVLSLGILTKLDYEVTGQDIDSLRVRAVGTRPDGTQVFGTPVSMKMAREEKWVRNEKYKTMPLYMLKKRAASFLINEVAPHIFGQSAVSVEELEDMPAAAKEREGPSTSDRLSMDMDLEQEFAGEVVDAMATQAEPEPAAEPATPETDEKHRLDMLKKVTDRLNELSWDNDKILEKTGKPVSMIKRASTADLLKIYGDLK